MLETFISMRFIFAFINFGVFVFYITYLIPRFYRQSKILHFMILETQAKLILLKTIIEIEQNKEKNDKI